MRLRLLKRRANRIVYDFDDSVMYRNSTAQNPLSKTRRRRFVRLLRASDAVIAGNEYLKKEALQYNPNVEVIPSPIDMERYALKSYDSKGNGLVLGWIGDHGSIHYLEKMRPVFDGLAAKYPDVRLKIVCDTFFQCDRMKVIEKQWSSEDEIHDLQSFDIGLMPLMDDPWSWGKCGLKILQYQGVGVPVVCTPVGINRDLVKDGENGLWAKDQREWIDEQPPTTPLHCRGGLSGLRRDGSTGGGGGNRLHPATLRGLRLLGRAAPGWKPGAQVQAGWWAETRGSGEASRRADN